MNFPILFGGTILPRYDYRITPDTYNLNYQPISFQSLDGMPLKGWSIQGVSADQDIDIKIKKLELLPLIIVCHGLGANKSDVLDLAAFLAKGGFDVLQFDFRGHGDSGGRQTSLGYKEQEDLRATLTFSKTLGTPRKIGILGFSLGGAVATLVTAEAPEVQALVIDSSYTSLEDTIARHLYLSLGVPRFPFVYLANWTYEVWFWTDSRQMSPLEAITKISPRPVLIINGEKDPRMTPEDAQRLYQAAGDPKTLWIVPEASHGETYDFEREEYERKVLEFFRRYLNPVLGN